MLTLTGETRPSQALRNCLARLHLPDFHFGRELLQLARPTRQHWEGSEVHGNDGFRLQELAGIGGFARPHSVVIANRNHGNMWRIKLVDDPHIAEDVGVAGMINLYSIGEFDDVSARFAAVNNLIPVLNATGVVGVHHGYFDVGDGLRASLVHGRGLLHAFFLQPSAQLGDADHLGVVLFADFDGVPDVIEMAVRAKQNVDFLDDLVLIRAHRISHDPGIDQNCFTSGCFNPKRCMAQPGQFDAVEVHIIGIAVGT